MAIKKRGALFKTVLAAFLMMLCLGKMTQLVWAKFIPPEAPADGWFVLDQSGTLSTEEIEALNSQIEGYRKSGRVEIGILILQDLGTSYLEEASIETARAWGIGEEGKNNGVLLLVVKDEHKIRIEVGTGLEGELTDAYSNRIIRNWIAPEFKEERYFKGLQRGLEGIAGFLQISDEVDVSSLKKDTPGDTLFLLIIFLMMIFFTVIILRKIRGGRYRIGGSSTSSGHWFDNDSDSSSSSSSGSSGGGGFSGGGSFGGGGASGSW